MFITEKNVDLLHECASSKNDNFRDYEVLKKKYKNSQNGFYIDYIKSEEESFIRKLFIGWECKTVSASIRRKKYLGNYSAGYFDHIR